MNLRKKIFLVLVSLFVVLGIAACTTAGDTVKISFGSNEYTVKEGQTINLDINITTGSNYDAAQVKKELVLIEYQVLQFVKQGYVITFESGNTEYVNNLGRVIKTSVLSKTVPYTITIEKDGLRESLTLTSVIQFTPYL